MQHDPAGVDDDPFTIELHGQFLVARAGKHIGPRHCLKPPAAFTGTSTALAAGQLPVPPIASKPYLQDDSADNCTSDRRVTDGQ